MMLPIPGAHPKRRHRWTKYPTCGSSLRGMLACAVSFAPFVCTYKKSSTQMKDYIGPRHPTPNRQMPIESEHPTSSDETRSVIHQWLDFVQAGHYDKLDTLASQDANWWVAGDKTKISLAGDMPYKQRQQMLGDLFGKADSYSTDLLSLTVEGKSATLEVLRKAHGPGSKKYENSAMMRFTVRNGKIVEIREYVDFITLGLYMGISGIFDILVHGRP